MCEHGNWTLFELGQYIKSHAHKNIASHRLERYTVNIASLIFWNTIYSEIPAIHVYFHFCKISSSAWALFFTSKQLIKLILHLSKYQRWWNTNLWHMKESSRIELHIVSSLGDSFRCLFCPKQKCWHQPTVQLYGCFILRHLGNRTWEHCWISPRTLLSPWYSCSHAPVLRMFQFSPVHQHTPNLKFIINN